MIAILPVDFLCRKDQTIADINSESGSKSRRRGDDAPRVALLVDTATGWGRRLIEGVFEYGHHHGRWHLDIQARGLQEPMLVPEGWVGDGIIARVSNPKIAAHVQSFGVPYVNVSSIQLRNENGPRVMTDPNLAAEISVKYFLDRGFKHFAYSGAERFSYVVEHRKAIEAALATRGLSLVLDRANASRRYIANHAELLDALVKWAKGLPKPCAVITWATQRGTDLLDACRYAGIAVPHEIAVLGGTYDELLCEAANPPLAGVQIASERIGFEAASLLDELMRGKPAPPEATLLPPVDIYSNPSTDTLAVRDHELVQVMRFIHGHALEPIQMPDILKHVPIARRTLERKFKEAFGRSPTDEIRYRRVNHAKKLLAETTMDLQSIADACCLNSYSYLSHVFKKVVGETPSQYRKRVRSV